MASRRSPWRFVRLGVVVPIACAASLCGAEPTMSEKPAGRAKRARAADAISPFECRFAWGKFTIDGRADEPAWKSAAVIDGFSLAWLEKDARPARTATRARLLWDREWLYFFVEMDDADVFADVKEHDGPTWRNDVFELFFKPDEEKQGYYEFEINALGTIFDCFFPGRGGSHAGPFVKADDFHVEAKVVVHGTLNKRDDRDQGWTVEGRIPWRDFMRTGGRPAVDEIWKFALCRYDYTAGEKEPELSSCAPLKEPNFHRHEDYVRLRFVGPGDEGGARPFGIERYVPVFSSKVVGSPDPPPPYQSRRVYPKLKMKWPIAAKFEPGSRRMYFINEEGPYGVATLMRTGLDPETGEVETLIPYDGVAYELAFHPDFEHNGYLYVGLNEPQKAKGVRKTKVKRYTIGRKPPYALDLKSERTIIEWPSAGHNGGALDFGLDGMLYVTSGDGTSDSDGDVVGQDLTRLTCKVLRIDVDHPAPGREYSVPRDNPFVGMKDVRPETWAYGLRNPWRLTVDRQTGHIWVGNNGQDLWEQAYLVRRGANYGWSVMEGSHPFYLDRKRGPHPISPPTVEHHHSEARSLTGGIVYHGSRLRELKGAYIYGDHSTGKIWGVRHDGEKILWQRELASTSANITGFASDPDGELLFLDQSAGALFTLDPTPATTVKSDFPTKLSESGLFRSVANHQMVEGAIPYTVNAPLWSDGTHKERYLVLPGKEAWLGVTDGSGWFLPNESVLVKSFALDLEEGNAQSRRWIETRFLTRQNGEWVGYSYIWNDEQTDATLVAVGGTDREFSIQVPRSAEHPDGIRKQLWHYPSRTECMVCHSRAANWVLGITTLQLNKEHDYGGVRDNQLRTLEHLGLLKTDFIGRATVQLQEDAKARGLTGPAAEKYVQARADCRDQRVAPQSRLLPAPPEEMPRMVDPYDKTADLDQRARSYLHSNCAHCHVEAGGGNAQFNAAFAVALANTKLVDVVPQHHKFGLKDARLIAPGDPDRSVLLYRVAHRGAGQMPPLATSIADRAAVELFREWIEKLEPPQPSTATR